jgi:MFS family permease
MKAKQATLRDSFIFRWGILLLVSITMAANYYFYDTLTPIQDNLRKFLHFSSTDYGIVTGFYAFPNTFLLMAVLGGIILDRIGIRITGTGFITFMVLGAWLTYYGASDYFNGGGAGFSLFSSFLTRYSPSVKMMSLGMLFFGLGAETGIVVFNKIVVKWFKDHELALAFAINLGIARLGTALAIKIGPRIADHYTWLSPIWFGALLMSIGFLAFMIYLMADVRLDSQIKKKEELTPDEERFRWSDLTKILKIKSFLYIAFLCVTFYAAFFPFLKFAPDFFLNKYNVSLKTSGDITFWLPIGTVLFTPIFGYYIDKKGKAATLMILGSFILIVVHLLFAFTRLNPYPLCILLGISFSLVPAAMWPSVAKIVSENRLGTAYGMMFSLQNLGLFTVPILTGAILDYTNSGIKTGERLDYTFAMIGFAVFGTIALALALILKREDQTSGYGLELPNKA